MLQLLPGTYPERVQDGVVPLHVVGFVRLKLTVVAFVWLLEADSEIPVQCNNVLNKYLISKFYLNYIIF